MGALSLLSLQFLVSQLMEGTWGEPEPPRWEEQGSGHCLINLTQVLPAEMEVMNERQKCWQLL